MKSFILFHKIQSIWGYFRENLGYNIHIFVKKLVRYSELTEEFPRDMIFYRNESDFIVNHTTPDH